MIIFIYISLETTPQRQKGKKIILKQNKFPMISDNMLRCKS
jgi:hypothetical protein